MRVQFYLTLVAMAFVVFAQAQTAEEIIENVKERYQSNNSFQADIAFEVDIPESENQVMRGTITLSGDRYRFTLANQEIISDGKTLWHWTKEDNINEVQVSYVNDDESVITPSKVFNDFLQGFNYQLVSTTSFDGEKLALIEFNPQQLSTDADVFKVKVIANTSNYSLREMQIFTKGDGTVYIFRIENEQPTEPQDELFIFKPSEHPETEVIDLR